MMCNINMKEGDIYMNGIFHNPNDAWRPRPQNPDDFGARTSAGCLGGMVMLVVMFIAFAIIAIFTGCSPKIIEREVVKTDTCFIQKERRDERLSICQGMDPRRHSAHRDPAMA